MFLSMPAANKLEDNDYIYPKAGVYNMTPTNFETSDSKSGDPNKTNIIVSFSFLPGQKLISDKGEEIPKENIPVIKRVFSIDSRDANAFGNKVFRDLIEKCGLEYPESGGGTINSDDLLGKALTVQLAVETFKGKDGSDKSVLAIKRIEKGA